MAVSFWVWMLVPAVIWSVIWKGLGLWHSAKRSHKIWFVVILIFNSLGVIPIIYLVFKTEFFKKLKRKKSKK